MPKQSQSQEVNRFVRGLITEASPLNFPADASADERNFVLNKDGTRDRRFGLDVEQPGTGVASGISSGDLGSVAVNTYVWKDVGGDGSLEYTVLQIGGELHILSRATGILSETLLFREVISSSNVNPFSFTSVDGLLVIATGSEELVVISSNGDDTFTQSSYRLLVRDQWGVSFSDLSGRDLYDANNVSRRPQISQNGHL